MSDEGLMVSDEGLMVNCGMWMTGVEKKYIFKNYNIGTEIL